MAISADDMRWEQQLDALFPQLHPILPPTYSQEMCYALRTAERRFGGTVGDAAMRTQLAELGKWEYWEVNRARMGYT